MATGYAQLKDEPAVETKRVSHSQRERGSSKVIVQPACELNPSNEPSVRSSMSIPPRISEARGSEMAAPRESFMVKPNCTLSLTSRRLMFTVIILMQVRMCFLFSFSQQRLCYTALCCLCCSLCQRSVVACGCVLSSVSQHTSTLRLLCTLGKLTRLACPAKMMHAFNASGCRALVFFFALCCVCCGWALLLLAESLLCMRAFSHVCCSTPEQHLQRLHVSLNLVLRLFHSDLCFSCCLQRHLVSCLLVVHCVRASFLVSFQPLQFCL